mgnify:CR=1 FL=1
MILIGIIRIEEGNFNSRPVHLISMSIILRNSKIQPSAGVRLASRWQRNKTEPNSQSFHTTREALNVSLNVLPGLHLGIKKLNFHFQLPISLANWYYDKARVDNPNLPRSQQVDAQHRVKIAELHIMVQLSVGILLN